MDRPRDLPMTVRLAWGAVQALDRVRIEPGGG
jgi:hypothetical protein